MEPLFSMVNQSADLSSVYHFFKYQLFRISVAFFIFFKYRAGINGILGKGAYSLPYIIFSLKEFPASVDLLFHTGYFKMGFCGKERKRDSPFNHCMSWSGNHRGDRDS